MDKNTIIKHQKLPSYLRELLNEDKKCSLIYSKKVSMKRSSSSSDPNYSLNDTDCDLDLTGNPLQVDLDTSVLSLPVIEKNVFHEWCQEECQHYPLSVNKAEELLNDTHNSKILDEPTFCITDACDSDKTVIIGSHNELNCITTYLVQIEENFPDIHTISDLSLILLNENNKFAYLKPSKVTYNVRKLYRINGLSFEDVSALESSKYQGCLFLQTSWNTPCIKEPKSNEIKLKFMMKVVSGYANSKIRYLWDQLNHLHELMNIANNAEKNSIENTVLSANSQTLITDIVDNINNVFMNVVNSSNHDNITSIEFTKLGEDTHLDKLWDFLNGCHTLKDLKCFWSVFLNSPKINAIINVNNDLKKVLESFINSRLSKLSHIESLQLMIEVGFQKLKKDYFTILNYYYPHDQTYLKQEWSKKEKGNSDEKLQFLIKIHHVAELLAYLEKSNVDLSRENLDMIFKQILDEYLKGNDSKEQLEAQLLEITCFLNADNALIYKKTTPLSTAFEIISYFNLRKMKTVFHVSKQPIFPPTIYQYRSQSEDLTETIPSMYVTKMHVSSTLKKEH